MENFENIPLVSVIVPIYKVEEYLPCCVESLCRQTYKKLEIILVDDGSPDRCGSLCDEYAQNDDRIRVIHKENGGLSDARNAGLDIAAGDYIVFVDSDDWLALDCVEKMIHLGALYCADIVACESEVCYEEKKRAAVFNIEAKKQEIVLDRDQAVLAWLYKRYYGVSACAKIYSRRCLAGVRFPMGRLHEDVGTTYKIFLQAEKVVYTEEKLYYYRQRQGSIVNSAFNKKRMDYLYFTEEIMVTMKEKYPQYYEAAVARHFQGCIQIGCAMEKPDQIILKELRKYAAAVMNNKECRKSYRILAGISMLCPGLSIRAAKIGMKVKGE